MINNFRFSTGQFAVTLFEFSFEGEDVLSFLDSQCTYDVHRLDPGNFHLTTLLDTTGKVETYGWLRRTQSGFSYLSPPELVERSRARLHRYLVSEDVEIRESGERTFSFILDPNSTEGEIFEERASLRDQPANDVPVIPQDVTDLWRRLNGWPDFKGISFTPDLINNTRFFDLALTMNKGCYPGQETVSKIATRRGAAYAPVMIETSAAVPGGEVQFSGNKIGVAEASLHWGERYFSPAKLLRDFRVAGMKLSFAIEGKSHHGLIRYYPLLKGDPESKAQELYDQGLDAFRNDDLTSAEKNLRGAIDLNPKHADAYEALGVMLGRLERYDEAISLMTRLSEVDPDSVMAHTNLSLFLMKQGKIEEAEAQKSLATVKSFKSFGTEAKKKEAEEERRKAEAADWARREKMFREVLEIDPEDTLANYGLGSLAVEKENWEEAQVYLERVIAEDPKYSVAYLALGRAYRGLGKIEESRKTFSEGIKVAAAKGDFMPANQMQAELDRT